MKQDGRASLAIFTTMKTSFFYQIRKTSFISQKKKKTYVGRTVHQM